MQTGGSLRRWVAGCAGAFLVTLFTGTLAAQQTGAIQGTVVAADNLQPVSSAQVFIPGSGLGTLTDENGQYRLQDVPAGEQQVRVQLLGYTTTTETVTVEAGQAATLDFELERKAVQLEQLVVTGTGTAGVERKQLGNTIATIDASRLENAPAVNVSEFLSAREPGVNVKIGGGLAGEGSQVRIRGTASLSQTQEPIVYVDGVRVSTGGDFGGTVSAGGGGSGSSSRLDDIDPNSIARIEILKGAAAATLYGTEASNGVIQIFTKSGREGAPRWDAKIVGGTQHWPFKRVDLLSDFPRDQAQMQNMNNLFDCGLNALYQVCDYPLMEEFAETGRQFEGNLTVNGGTSGLTYFLSGYLQYQDGPMAQNPTWQARDIHKKISGTANFNLFPSDVVRIQLRSNYTNTHQETPQTTNNIFGLWPAGLMAQLRLATPSNPKGAPAFATTREIAQVTTEQDVDHYGGSVGIDLRPSESVTLHGTFGVDVASQRDQDMFPFGWNVDGLATFATRGWRDVNDRISSHLTAEIRGGWDTEVGQDWTSTLSFGGQGFLLEQNDTGGFGQDFPGPGLEVVGAAANQTVLESFLQNVNAGVFAQEQLGYRDFAYVTLGGRYDVNSAFGEEFSGVFYPKASFSLVFSDLESWNSETLSTFRLRGAIGKSGLQPGAFDKFRTFSSQASAAGPGVAPDNLGNQELEPEVSTEIEGGAEFGLFNDRLGGSVTYWHRTVDKALVRKQFPVSGGFSAQQLVNIGQMQSEGVELSLNASVYSSENLDVSLWGNTSYLSEEVTDLGGAPPLKSGGSYPRYRNFIREGYAPGAFFGTQLQDVPIPLQLTGDCTAPTEQEALAYFSQPRNPSDFEVLPVACGQVAQLDQYIGKPTPDFEGSFGTDINFLRHFELSTLLEYRAGDFFWSDLSGAFARSNSVIGRNTPLAARTVAILEDPASTAEERLAAAQTWARELRALAPMSGLNMIDPADYLRWREASLTYRAPQSFANTFGFNSLSFAFRVRNLAIWINDQYKGISPELEANARCSSGTPSSSTDCNFLIGTEAFREPLPRRFTLELRAGF